MPPKKYSTNSHKNDQVAPVFRQHYYYFDYLRICATFAVIVIHVAGPGWSVANIGTTAWDMLNFYNGSLVRWAVPIFIMISGALFLSGKQSVEQIYKKNILRIIISYTVWSFLYAAVRGGGAKVVIAKTIEGHYHLWFLPMIAGLYVMTPLFRKMVESPALEKYFLVVSLITMFIVPRTISWLFIINKQLLSGSLNALNTNTWITFKPVFYFVLGHFLNQTELPKKLTNVLYVSGIFCFFVYMPLTSWLSERQQEPANFFYLITSLNICLESAAIFLFAKNRWNSPKCKENGIKILCSLSKYSFGAYLVHALFVDRLISLVGVDTLCASPLVSVFVISCVVFVASFAVSAIINKIPIIKNYIV